MKKNLQFFGIAGLVLLCFGLFTYFRVNYDKFYFIQIHIALGLFLILAFFIFGGLKALNREVMKRNLRFFISVIFYSAAFLALLIFINFFAKSKEVFYYDSTEQKVHTLSPQTKKVLENLKDKIIIRAFYVSGSIDEQTKNLLNRFSNKTENLSWREIDPEKKPASVEKYNITQSHTLHLSLDKEGSNRESKILGEITEENLINAVLKITRGDAKNIYYLSGHGEPNIEGKDEKGYYLLQEAIQGENLILKNIVLAQHESIPEDAAAVILAAPKKELLEKERVAIEEYLNKGGAALLLNEPNSTTTIREIADNYAINVGNNLVVDQVVRLFAGPALGVQPIVGDFSIHPITADFSEKSILLSTSSSVSIKIEGRAGRDVVELAKTSESSWAETNLEKIFSEEPSAKLENDDEQGPISIAAVYEKEIVGEENKETTRLAVIGDSDFVNNVNIRQVFNRDFFLNTLNWVVGQENSLTIRPKSMRESTKGLTEEEFSSIFLFTAILLPECILLFGLAIWWNRRS